MGYRNSFKDEYVGASLSYVIAVALDAFQ